MENTYGHKSAIILSGGGANGAFEVGVMKALLNGLSPATNRTPLEPDIYCGTSVGSYNAAFMISRTEAGGPSAITDLEDTWVNRVAENASQCGNGIFRFRGDPLEFLSLQCLTNHPLKPFIDLAQDSVVLTMNALLRGTQFARSSESLERRILNLFALTPFISVEPLVQTIRQTIDLEAIRRSPKVGKYVTTDWEAGRLNIFENPDMTDDLGNRIIRASAAIPGFFPPVYLNGRPHVDGGVLLTTPLSPAIQSGADVIHVIFLDPSVENIPVERLQSTLDVMDRLYAIMTASQFKADINRAAAINAGLRTIQQVSERVTPTEAEVQAFFQIVDEMEEYVNRTKQYKPLEIHVYAPKDDLEGVLGLLDFDRNRLINLIERGFKNAVEHDCEANGCILLS